MVVNMKLFLKRWLIVAGLSVPISVGSWLLMFFINNLILVLWGTPILYFIFVFALSALVCKADAKQAFLVALTSPGSLVHCYVIYIIITWR